jgi:hypothetical protein
MARPKRSETQEIENRFADLSNIEQAKMLETLAQLHRWSLRIRGQKPAAEPETEKETA